MKEYPDQIVILGTSQGRLVLYVSGSKLPQKVKHWRRDDRGNWKVAEYVWPDWLSVIVDGCSGRNARIIYAKQENVTELALACETLALPLVSAMQRQGGFSDEEWGIVSSLPQTTRRRRKA